jgi:hypothetical protein
MLEQKLQDNKNNSIVVIERMKNVKNKDNPYQDEMS